MSFTDTVRFRKKLYAAALFAGFCGLLTTAGGCHQFSSQSYNAEGVRMLSAYRTDEALDCFEKAVAADPQNPDAYYNLGNVYHQVARQKTVDNEPDFQRAVYYYDKCLEISPNHVECNRSKATLFCDVGRNEEAFRVIEAWVSRQPASADPRVELARLYDENGKLPEARNCLEQAVAVDNRNVRAYTSLGSVRERLGENQSAISAYEHALALNPYQPSINDRVASLRYAPPATNNITTPPMGEPFPRRENSLDDTGRSEIATQPGEGTVH